MPKGMYTQGFCVLFEQAPSLDAIEASLGEFEVAKRLESSEEWAMSGPSLVLLYRPEVNGLVAVDIVDQKWPDHMGDPQGEPMIFGAWSMGHFGPFAYPGGLDRAAQQAWTWPPGKDVPDRHGAFVRVRVSYAFGADGNDPIIPDTYDAVGELDFISRVTLGLLEVPGAICYFNPNGEVLRDKQTLQPSLEHGWSNDFLPVDAWTNVRMFNLNQEWSLMDTVGNAQLDMPDMEACFHANSYDLNQIDFFLRNVSLYIANQGEVIKDGDTMDGPGEIRWQANALENGICDPPRRVLRWHPEDGRELPPEFSVSANPE